MAIVEIDKNTCIGCTICVGKCPFGALSMVEKVSEVDPDKCVACGLCVEPCPVDAITLPVPEQLERLLADISNYKGVWVFIEHRNGVIRQVSRELLGIGSELVKHLKVELSGVLVGSGIEGNAREVIEYGADRVYVVDDERLLQYRSYSYARAVSSLVKQYKPEVLLIGATLLGRELASCIATEVKAGLTADCTGLGIDKKSGVLAAERPTFGGNIMATILCPVYRPQMATARPGVFAPLERDSGRKGEVIREDMDGDIIDHVEVLEFIPEKGEEVDLEGVDVVISGGMGLGSRDKFRMLEELADLVDGEIGASRLAVESGWISKSHQVGQTGKTVRPTLYIACGISGAVQHLVGMHTSDQIVSINSDPDAPIFDTSNYGIVGNLNEVVPALTKALKERLR